MDRKLLCEIEERHESVKLIPYSLNQHKCMFTQPKPNLSINQHTSIKTINPSIFPTSVHPSLLFHLLKIGYKCFSFFFNFFLSLV